MNFQSGSRTFKRVSFIYKAIKNLYRRKILLEKQSAISVDENDCTPCGSICGLRSMKVSVFSNSKNNKRIFLEYRNQMTA